MKSSPLHLLSPTLSHHSIPDAPAPLHPLQNAPQSLCFPQVKPHSKPPGPPQSPAKPQHCPPSSASPIAALCFTEPLKPTLPNTLKQPPTLPNTLKQPPPFLPFKKLLPSQPPHFHQGSAPVPLPSPHLQAPAQSHYPSSYAGTSTYRSWSLRAPALVRRSSGRSALPALHPPSP